VTARDEAKPRLTTRARSRITAAAAKAHGPATAATSCGGGAWGATTAPAAPIETELDTYRRDQEPPPELLSPRKPGRTTSCPSTSRLNRLHQAVYQLTEYMNRWRLFCF
jgi:hypothetical protein